MNHRTAGSGARVRPDLEADAEIREAARRYNLTGPIARVGSVYRIEGRPAAILKPLKVGTAQALAIVRLLERERQDFLPELIKPAAGPGYLWLRGNRYLATRLLPGRSADYYRDRDLTAAIRLMAAWHAATAALLARDPMLARLLAFNPAPVWERRLRELDACRILALRRRHPFSAEYLAVWPQYRAQAAAALAELQSGAGTAPPAVICYHDWAFHNVLIAGEKAALIDFDYMVADTPGHDRANLLGRYLRLFRWSPQALFRMLRHLDRDYGWRRGELRLTRIYLTFPYDYWMLGRQFYIERQPWSDAYFRDQWRRKIAAQQLRFSALKMLERLE